MSGATKQNLSLLLTSIGLLLGCAGAYAGDDYYCRRRCGYPANPYWESCFQKCMGPAKHKTETMKPGASGDGFSRGAFQPSCGPGYMAVNGRCVSAKARR